MNSNHVDRRFAVLGVAATIFAIFYGAWFSNVFVILDEKARPNTALTVTMQELSTPQPNSADKRSMLVTVDDGSLAEGTLTDEQVQDLRGWLAVDSWINILMHITLLSIYLLVLSYFFKIGKQYSPRWWAGLTVVGLAGAVLVWFGSGLFNDAENRFGVQDYIVEFGRGLLNGFVVVSIILMFITAPLDWFAKALENIIVTVTVRLPPEDGTTGI